MALPAAMSVGKSCCIAMVMAMACGKVCWQGLRQDGYPCLYGKVWRADYALPARWGNLVKEVLRSTAKATR